MEGEKHKVVIDADFFRHTTDHEIGTGLFVKILQDFKYEPVMHDYVCKVELKNNVKLKELIDAGKIEIIKDSDYLNEEDIEDYKDYFVQAFEHLNPSLFEGDPLKYGYDGTSYEESLGEIRSFYLALKRGYNLLLSDDDDSVQLSKFVNSSKHNVRIKDLFNLLIEDRSNGGSLQWKDLKASIPKVYKNKTIFLDKIVELYIDSKKK